MKHTILIPIDFTADSLYTLQLVLSELETNMQTCHVVLMYSEYLSDSITELLYYNPQKRIKALTNESFSEALSMIRNRFESSIASISIQLFNGYNKAAFRNFAEAERINHVYIPSNYQFKCTGRAFNPCSLIKNSGIPYGEVSHQSNSI